MIFLTLITKYYIIKLYFSLFRFRLKKPIRDKNAINKDNDYQKCFDQPLSLKKKHISQYLFTSRKP